jgi:Spy/CpxP family protein refolding chaperone
MKKLKSLLLLAGVAAALSTGSVLAQQGNFDPAEFRQRMMDGIRERLEVKSDDEWKIVSERVEKVMTAQRDARGFGGGGMFGRAGGPGGGRRNNDGGNANANNDGGNRRRGGAGMFGGEESQESKDLRAAIEAKAPADEIKAKLEKYRAYRKSKEAELQKAQASLKEVLNARQEATAVLAGWLQ